MDDYVLSAQFNNKYRVKDVVRIIDQKQYSLYLLYGAKVIDVYGSYDNETGKPITVFVFNRSDTYELYDLWRKEQLI